MIPRIILGFFPGGDMNFAQDVLRMAQDISVNRLSSFLRMQHDLPSINSGTKNALDLKIVAQATV